MAVAASGGRDSTALLHCTARAARELGLQVHALHVHHGLWPAADDWQRHLTRQCARWARAGLPLTLHVQRLAGAPPRGASVEAWARRERYAALGAMARTAGCDTVLLAHHRRDQAETLLLQALRGAGPRGMAAMPAAIERDGIRWLRPWLAQPREAIEAYVARHRLAHVDDDSNADPRFARNRLRHAVWPALVRAFPDAEASLAAAARRAAQDADCLDALADSDAAAGAIDGGALVLAAWRALPAARAANLLRHWLRQACGRGAPETLLQRLLAELGAADIGRWPAPGGELRLYRGRVQFAAAPAAPAGTPLPPILALDRPGAHPLPAGQGTLLVARARAGGIAPERLRAARLGARQPGDRFQLAPSALPRGLKKQFQALGVPAWARCGPVLRGADGSLLFVAGLGLDARCWAPAGRPQYSVSWVPAGIV